MIRTAFLVLLAAPATAADFEFCWIGANGYTLEGRMSVPDNTLSQLNITEADITAFAISGYQDGLPIGGWSMADVTPTTSWNLNFNAQTTAFTTGGYSSSMAGQQWNAGGAVNDCGDPGFGFNAGAGGQDICLNNTYKYASIVAYDTPILAHPLGEGPPCGASPLLGSLLIPTPQG